MQNTCKFLLTFLTVAGLMIGATTARASAGHHFDIINKSSHTVTLRWETKCVTSANKPSPLAPGQTVTINWEDTNNISAGCTNRDKVVAFAIQVDGFPNAWNGYLGITHRKLSGSSWYNGQFYASTLQLEDLGPISCNDGNAPPSWVQALCSHDNQCFGPCSQMEMDGKNSYNWQRSYQTEDGWAFQISDPN
jgi:hypothetical protein